MNATFDFSDSAMNPIRDQSPDQGPTDRPSSSERFELLSAYMDGEVTAEERRLVESWLANDSKMRQMQQRLLVLRHGLSTIPTPEPIEPVDATIDKVFEKVERRSRFRVIVGGVVAAAAAVVATVVGVNTIGNAPAPQMAKQSPTPRLEQIDPTSETSGAETASVTTQGLLISLDTPVLSVSKTASGGVKTANSVTKTVNNDTN
jgi:anti-sigma factor RsiW